MYIETHTENGKPRGRYFILLATNFKLEGSLLIILESAPSMISACTTSVWQRENRLFLQSYCITGFKEKKMRSPHANSAFVSYNLSTMLYDGCSILDNV